MSNATVPTYVALPIHFVIYVQNPEEAQRAKQTAQQLLSSDMVKLALQQTGLRVYQTTVGEPYPCAPPQQQ